MVIDPVINRDPLFAIFVGADLTLLRQKILYNLYQLIIRILIRNFRKPLNKKLL